jgi:hypothetical protein
LKGRVKILHGHVNFELALNHVTAAAAVLNKSEGPRVYIAGTVFEQKIVGRLVSKRKAHKVGRFSELAKPAAVMMMRAKRLRDVIKERGITGTLAKVFAVK